MKKMKMKLWYPSSDCGKASDRSDAKERVRKYREGL
jgi:hypothetical protein